MYMFSLATILRLLLSVWVNVIVVKTKLRGNTCLWIYLYQYRVLAIGLFFLFHTNSHTLIYNRQECNYQLTRALISNYFQHIFFCSWWYGFLWFKGTPKFYFTHYLCVVIILFNTGLCKSAFSTYSFGKLDFRLSVFSVIWIWCHLYIINFERLECLLFI